MPFPFSNICTLLSRLEDVELRDPPLRAQDKLTQAKPIIESWFKSHRRSINELSIDNAAALLSTLLPERRTDRVYWIRAPGLCRILCRCLGLSSTRAKDLQAYTEPSRGDLGACLQRVLKSGGAQAQPAVTLDEIDDMLETLAGRSRSSTNHKGKLPAGSCKSRDDLLGDIFKRLSSLEGKWLVRMILKDLSPVQINEALLLRNYHFLLPDVLRFQDDFYAAIGLLKGALQGFPHDADPRSQKPLREAASAKFRPVVGIKVGRPIFLKARSINHCINMLGGQQWVLERKYDGEYCEIHIDRTASTDPTACITIFSKSGKNSTDDRKGLHQTLVDCLGLESPACKIQRQAILLGELVVYSDAEHQIMPFDKIRKHVSRSGRMLGTDEDSYPSPHEHLAIVFFDLLLLDDEIVMTKPLDERRTWLREVYQKIGGRAMSSEWKIVDFADDKVSRKALVQQFAASIAERCEGLVLKPCNAPYFSVEPSAYDGVKAFIKLKKDYMTGLGDEADFAVIGGSYHAQHAAKCGVPNVKWTDFHLGCLMNKPEVVRFDARPRFKYVGSVHSDGGIPKEVLQGANTIGKSFAQPYSPGERPANLDIKSNTPLSIDTTFDSPFVFEVLGSGFVKPPNCSFKMLRHPRVKKLHWDRTWKDCVSMQELQEQAAAAQDGSIDSEAGETVKWIEKLESKCRKRAQRLESSTPRTRTTTTPSTARKKAASASPRSARLRQRARRTSNITMSSGIPSSEEVGTALHGTTLIEKSAMLPKRLHEQSKDSPCPPPKRLKAAPLSDITNTAPRLEKTIASLSGAKSPRPPVASSTKSRPQDKIFPVGGTEEHIVTKVSLDDTHSPSQSPFADAVVYLNTCVAGTPYIAQDLLSAHNTSTVSALTHWDRDSYAHTALSEVVSESQAFAGLRKIVLVESKRPQRVRETVKQLVQLNQGRWRERVEVWDWRALEADTDLASTCTGATRQRHFLGATTFDEASGRSVFVSAVDCIPS